MLPGAGARVSWQFCPAKLLQLAELAGIGPRDRGRDGGDVTSFPESGPQDQAGRHGKLADLFSDGNFHSTLYIS